MPKEQPGQHRQILLNLPLPHSPSQELLSLLNVELGYV